MALTFAERMAARQKALEAGTLTTAPALTTPQKEEDNAEAAVPATTSTSSSSTGTAPSSRFGFKATQGVQTVQASGGGEPSKPSGFGFRKAQQAEEGKGQEEARVLESGPTKEVVSALPKVIQAFNVSGAAKPTMGEDLSGLPPQEAVKKIQQQIADLSKLENEVDLKYEMEKLSEMLVANPSACLYLLDEDLGLAVRALRKMTDNRVAIDMGRAKPKTGAKALGTAKAMSAADIAAALDEL